MIQIEIDGDPIPWQRPGHRNLESGGKLVNIIYDKQKKEKEQVQWQIRGQYKEDPLVTPLRIELIFRMRIPKATSAPIRREMLNGVYQHAKRPDIDNLVKFIFDTMNGLVFVDDSQISSLKVDKIYSTYPGTTIRIMPFSRNNEKNLEENIDENSLRNDGPGELSGCDPDQERNKKAGRKNDTIVPFRAG